MSDSDAVTIGWNGPDLVAALHVFQNDVSRQIVKQAINDAAAEALRQLQAAAPRRTGRLEHALAVRSRGANKVYVTVATRGKANDPNNAFYWRFLEQGHRTRPDKLGASRGQVPPLYFIRNTWLRLQSTITTIFFTQLDRGTNKTYTKD